MNLAASMLYFFEVMAVVAAIALLFTRNVFYAALFLITVLLSLAGLYVLAFAEFVAVTQILVYAGGILVVIIFSIMLTSKLSDKPLVVEHGNTFAGSLIGLSFFLLLLYSLSREFLLYNDPGSPGITIEQLGIGLMTDYAFRSKLQALSFSSRWSARQLLLPPLHRKDPNVPNCPFYLPRCLVIFYRAYCCYRKKEYDHGTSGNRNDAQCFRAQPGCL